MIRKYVYIQDPAKAVDAIIDNITLARPAFNNPVGKGIGTLW